MRLGRFEIYALTDGTFTLDGGQMFGVVPKPLWEKKLPADSRNRVRLGLTCLLVQTGKRNVLIETGIGDKFDAKFADIYGIDHSSATLLAGLDGHGIRPEEVNLVINTHLHFDHCGWNTRSEGSALVPTFSRARYFVQRGEWDHAFQPTERDRGSYREEFFAAAERQTEFLEGDAEIAPGIHAELLPGHTQHMQGVRITSEGQEAYFVSDLIPTCAHLPYPWIMSFDLYPLETLANKKRLLPRLVEEHTLVVFPHDPAIRWARLEERDGRISAVPAPSQI
ncbi:MAG TPA: MBL fold metallo-hydrolase [Terriglobia bacterium]|nr:MBL fold metallo-hydrolase [Terriglobia bacterium]